MCKRHRQFASIIFLFTLSALVCVETTFAQKAKNSKQTEVSSATKNKKNSTTQDSTGTGADRKLTGTTIRTSANQPPAVLTLAVGQVTTIKLPDTPLQIQADKDGLVITESNKKSSNKNIYLIPSYAGINRNLIIELPNGKVEFELQSFAVENGKSRTFTREVEVKNSVVENQKATLENQIIFLKAEIEKQNKIIQSFPDQSAALVHDAEKRELGNLLKTVLRLYKAKKGKTAQSQNKNWTITELFRQTDSDRIIRVIEISYRGKSDAKILDLKSPEEGEITWKSNKNSISSSSPVSDGREGIVLQKGEKIEIAVCYKIGKSEEIIISTDEETIKF